MPDDTAATRRGASASYRFWLLIILLAAVFLRLHELGDVPPGLTHDEADHGLDAWGVVNGTRPIYFTVGFGREPLFDYATAGLMAFLGPTYLAGRLTAVFFSLVLLAGAYAWARQAFGRPTALLLAAGLAVEFWPVMTARQALRSETLPAILVLAVFFFWRYLAAARRPPERRRRMPALDFLLAGALLGVTFYTYLPARLTWLLFPLLALYICLAERHRTGRYLRATLLALLVAAAVGLPIFGYLALNPGAEARLDHLTGPLAAAGSGDWRPLLANVAAGLRLLTLEGDSEWRYNIAGRPFLGPIQGALFYLGLAVAGYQAWQGARNGHWPAGRGQGAASFLALAWLLLGLAPALSTGAALSTTRAIAAQPVVYLFPAMALVWLYRQLAEGSRGAGWLWVRRLEFLVPPLLYGGLLAQTAGDYFVRWANHPEVRVQYETALVAAIDYLDKHGSGAAAISTTTPNRYHSPAVALLTLSNETVEPGWFNGQASLLLPRAASATLIFTHFAALNPALAPYFAGAERVATLPMRPTDLDRPVTVYSVDGTAMLAAWQSQFATGLANPAGASLPASFGEVVELLGYDLQTPRVMPGEWLRLATLWRARRPLAEVTEVVLFTHLPGSEGKPLAQADRLDAPAASWRDGDVFIQLHEFQIPAGTAAGDYSLRVGLYTRPGEERLPALIGGAPVGDALELPAVSITP